jgi:probable HAF family extracellular repeat protein
MRIAIFLLIAASARAATLYQIADLGAVGSGAATSLNHGGVVTGYTEMTAGRQAFSTAGSLASAGSESVAQQGNNFGQVVGTAWNEGRARAVTWAGGLTSLLAISGAGESFGQAINDYGHVAGAAGSGSGGLQAFLLAGNHVQWLGTLAGGSWSSAYGLNTRGHVVGSSQVAGGAFHAFFWSAETGMQDLGTLGGLQSYAAAINQSGAVVGHSMTAGSGETHAFVWSGGQMWDLGTLAGGTSHASGINSQGDIVGRSDGSAFLYRAGVMADLNRLIAPESGWNLVDAHAINDTGQIAGVGYYQGELRAFRLDPVAAADVSFGPTVQMLAVEPGSETPEPATFALIGVALIAVSRLRRTQG